MNKEIKVFIVEDHQIFRTGLKMILSEIDNINLVGEAENGQEFLKNLKYPLPDIVFMDIKMPVMDGFKATELALAKHPSLKIIALSMFGEEEYVQKIISLGVSGFILKNSDKNTIEKAIHQVMRGNHFFSEELMSILVSSINKAKNTDTDNTEFELSEREIQVLKLISKGHSNKEIAEKLYISPRTVEGYKSKLIQKTGLKNSLSLVLWSFKNNIL